MYNKAIQSTEISRQPVQKLTHPPLSTPCPHIYTPYLALFMITKHEMRFFIFDKKKTLPKFFLFKKCWK